MATVRKYHKYFALTLGVFLLGWIVSGVTMLLPAPTPRALAARPLPQPDFATVTVSPAELVRTLTAHAGGPVAVRRITLRGLGGRPVYHVEPRNAAPSFWDGVTGRRITINSALAERLVRERVHADVGKARIVRIDKYSMTYPNGPLPAYRVEFENGRGTIAFVGVPNGRIVFTDWRKRARQFVTGLHEFGPLDVLFQNGRLTRGALLGVGSLTLVIVITGFCLGLLPQSKKRQGS